MRRLCLFIVLCLVWGCSGAPPENLSLAVGGAPAEIEVWEEVVRDFERATGVQVNLLRQPTDSNQRRQGLVVPLEARQSDPDVFLMDVAWLAQFAASGWLAPLNALIKQGRGREVFFAEVIALADRHQGSLLALPMNMDGGLLYYRRDLLTRFGFEEPPQTWAELVAQAAAVQAEMRFERPNFYGFVWQGAQYEGLVCTFLEFAGSGGGVIINDGQVRLNLPANVSALTFMRDLIWEHRLSPPNTYTEMKEEEVRSHFQRGDALFERNWPYAWALHQSPDSPVKGQVGLAPLPHFAGRSSVSTLGGWHVGLSRFSDAPSKALALIKFLTSFEVQKKFTLKLGWNPGRVDVYDDEEVLARLPHLRRLREVLAQARPRPVLPYYTQLSAVLQRRLNAALADKETPAAALAAAEAEVQSVVHRYEGG